MNETIPPLSVEEAQAIDAISGSDTGTSQPQTITSLTSPEEPFEPGGEVEATIEPEVDSTASHGFISAAEALHLAPDTHLGHEDHDHDAPDAGDDHADVMEMRSAMLDSADLANRAAGMAAKAAAEMHGLSAHLNDTATTMTEAHKSGRIYLVVVLTTFAALMLSSMALFGFMSYRLQSRITAADEMLLAVGKRIVTMNETMELITGAGETLRDINSRQDTIVGGQAKLDARLDEVVTAMAQAAAQAASKPADAKAQDLGKMLQALDAKLQAQTAALNALSSQVRAVPQTPKPDAAAVRREVEAALRQQKAAEAANKPVVVAPLPPPAPPAKPKESLVQYPRAQAAGKEAP